MGGGGLSILWGNLRTPQKPWNYRGKLKILLPQQIITHEFDGKYMKIKFTSNGDLPLRKTLELHKIIIANKSVFNEAVNTIHNLS